MASVRPGEVDMDAQDAARKALNAIGANKKATVYLSPTLVVSVCRRFKLTARATRQDFVLKIGRPNYLEVRFIAACKKAGEPFPVKKVQLKPWPKTRKAKI